MEIRKIALVPRQYYHIFNRGINGSAVFFEDKNYRFFLEKYTQYVFPWVKTFAFCLLGNHYHLLIQVRSEEVIDQTITKNKEKNQSWHISNAFSSFLQSYTRAMNKTYERTGALFETPFKRIEVTDSSYFSTLISYIHQNPQKHGIIEDFRDYPFSSYWSHLSLSKKSNLEREQVLEWFGGSKPFEAIHQSDTELKVELTLEAIN